MIILLSGLPLLLFGKGNEATTTVLKYRISTQIYFVYKQHLRRIIYPLLGHGLLDVSQCCVMSLRDSAIRSSRARISIIGTV